MLKVPGKRFRGHLACSTAIIALCASSAQAQTVALYLPPQPLSASLIEIAKKTGENIIFSQASLNGIQAPALSGQMSARQAVERLIDGQNLEVAAVGGDGLVVRSARERRSDASKFASQLIKASDAPIRLAQAGGTPVQSAPQQPIADTSMEQVVVSGSRVTIAGYSQPTPVTMVGAAQLQQNAYAAIVDSVRNLPQLTSPPSSFNNQAGFSGGSIGTNTVNLRNLGVNRTLVLFDSQRVGVSGLAGGVDTTTLPSTLVSRIDVVTGGASAAWGSDAVAGVVNFVINKNFTGFKANFQVGADRKGRGRELSVESAWGDDIFGGRGHFEVAAKAHMKPDSVLLIDKNWFKGAYFVSNPAYTPTNGQPQLIVATNVGVANAMEGGIINSSPAGVAGPGVTAAPANALRGIAFVDNGIPQVVNYGNLTNNTISNGGSFTMRDSQDPYSTIANASNTYSFFGYGRYKITDAVQASVQVNYGYFMGTGTSGPLQQTALVIKSDNAFIPASVRATMQAGGITSFTMGILNANNFDQHSVTGETYMRESQGALGPEYVMNRRNTMRGVFTLDGTFGEDWSWTAYIQHSGTRYSAHAKATVITANLTAAEDAVTVTTANRGTSGLPLGSIVCRSSLPGQSGVVVGRMTSQPGCIPLNVFGNGVASPAAIAYIIGASTGSLDEAHQILSQEVAEASMQGTLPWELPAGKVAVAFGAGYRKEGARTNTTVVGSLAGYTAGNFPSYPPVSYSVLEGFGEIDAPILRDNIVNSLDISMAGRITDYSTSGMVETWKLGMTSQVNDDIRLRATWSVDIRAPQIADLFNPGSVGTQNSRDPKSQQTVSTQSFTTGNPNLLPEVARTVSGGIVMTPSFIEGLSLSADWYSINITGVITRLSADLILSECNASLPSTINKGQNGNPNDPLCSHLIFAGPGGALSGIRLDLLNFNSQSVSGLDLQANYSTGLWGGELAFASTSSYTDQITITQPGQGINNVSGANDLGPGGDQVSAGPKWKGIVGATYTEGPYSFTANARWFGTSLTYRNGNTGNQASAASALLYDPAHHQLDMTAYLDLRASYKWNDNISFFGAIDNALNIPPPLIPPVSGSTSLGSTGFYNTNQYVFDMIGRYVRMGVRFSY